MHKRRKWRFWILIATLPSPEDLKPFHVKFCILLSKLPYLQSLAMWGLGQTLHYLQFLADSAMQRLILQYRNWFCSAEIYSAIKTLGTQISHFNALGAKQIFTPRPLGPTCFIWRPLGPNMFHFKALADKYFSFQGPWGLTCCTSRPLGPNTLHFKAPWDLNPSPRILTLVSDIYMCITMFVLLRYVY